MSDKYYAVRVGRIPGIYMSWGECEKMVKGYKGAVYKSFTSIEEARDFISNLSKEVDLDIDVAYAFVDGSFNPATGVYGYGGFLVENSDKHIIKGSGSDTEMAAMRNVAGEVEGSIAAIKLAMELGITRLIIYYDYMGIEKWATGEWKRNKKGTIAYYDFIQKCKGKIDVSFVKVKGHSGVDGNEEADKLAKEAVGIL